MNLRKGLKYIGTVLLAAMFAVLPLAGAGCAGAQSVTGTIADALAGTMVPNLDLDLYIYINQFSPTRIPKNLIGTPNDLSVDALAVWGVVNGDQYSISGALTFTAASDASNIFAKLPQNGEIWTKLADRTIYFVQGSGGPADSLKSLISNGNFKKFDDKKSLDEVGILPVGAATKPAGVAIVKPSPALVNLIKRYTNQNTAATIDNLNNGAKPQTLVFGLYSAGVIDIADVLARASNNTLWDADLGVLASVNSIYPGVVFAPVASKVLDDQGFAKMTVGNLTVYRAVVDAGNGKTIPVLINVDGSHVFAVISGKESYAQALLTGIKR